LPYEAQEALRIYSLLPHDIAGMGVYNGKKLELIKTFFEIYEVPYASQRPVFDLILYFINRSINQANEEVLKEQEKRKKEQDATPGMERR
jgi:hypothetical protein